MGEDRYRRYVSLAAVQPYLTTQVNDFKEFLSGERDESALDYMRVHHWDWARDFNLNERAANLDLLVGWRVYENYEHSVQITASFVQFPLAEGPPRVSEIVKYKDPMKIMFELENGGKAVDVKVAREKGYGWHALCLFACKDDGKDFDMDSSKTESRFPEFCTHAVHKLAMYQLFSEVCRCGEWWSECACSPQGNVRLMRTWTIDGRILDLKFHDGNFFVLAASDISLDYLVIESSLEQGGNQWRTNEFHPRNRCRDARVKYPWVTVFKINVYLESCVALPARIDSFMFTETSAARRRYSSALELHQSQKMYNKKLWDVGADFVAVVNGYNGIKLLPHLHPERSLECPSVIEVGRLQVGAVQHGLLTLKSKDEGTFKFWPFHLECHHCGKRCERKRNFEIKAVRDNSLT